MTGEEACLRQALWNIYGILGFDQDGMQTAPRPGTYTPDLPELVVEAAKEFRADYDAMLKSNWL